MSKCTFLLVHNSVACSSLQINGSIFVSFLDPATNHSELNFCRVYCEAMNADLGEIDCDSLLSNKLDFLMIIFNFFAVIWSDINTFSPKFYRRNLYFLRWNTKKLKTLHFNKKRLHRSLKLSKPVIYRMIFFVYVIIESRI